MINIKAPLTDEVISGLHAGDQVLVNGTVYVGRDAAHQRMVEALERGEALPFDPRGQIIYYMGPSPAAPGRVIGAAGPTTAGRMDTFAPQLLAEGLKGMIGKGVRNQTVKEAIKQYQAVYLASVGGVGALAAMRIKKSQVIAYEEFGPEALLRLEVEDFPVTVINDIYGADLYEEGIARFRKRS